MGPAGLEVKRYIGSCLISGGRDVQVPLCGLPLVAVPPLSRLALHTHGAPLILAGRGRRHAPRHHQHQQRPPPQQQHKPQAPAAAPPPAAAGDSPSTASDESSGPADAALPRIIKPRKRRKKDRKPAAATSAPASTPAREGSSIVTLRPYVPLCYEGAAATKPPQAQQQQRSKPQQVPSPPPQQAPASACQCRYCDPRGHIWDVRRHCYSAVLTPPPAPESPFASIPLFLAAPPTGAAAADSDAGFCSEGLPALRRSFSACSTSSSSSSSSSAGDASQGLQVSTEIVTSPNGHRDLEIRFYSCSPPADADTDTSASAAGAGAACSEEASDSEQEGDGECAEKLLGESLWANIVQEE